VPSEQARLIRQLAILQAKIAGLEYATSPAVVWRIKCVFPCTSLVLKIKAKSTEDAVHAARRSRYGKHAVEYVILGSA